MVNVSKDFQDYDDDDKDLKFRESRFRYWEAIRKLRVVFTEETGTDPLDDIYETECVLDEFYKWVEDTCGFKPTIVDGMITEKYEITDEQKYLIYLIKYGE